jgi:hypothetical protein
VDDSANQAATSILIDSFTGQTAGVFGTSTNDVLNWSAQFNNSFTVSAGEIVAATFAAQDADIRGSFCLDRGGCLGDTNVLRLQIPDIRISNADGFAGVTFRNITAVPEPRTVGLIALGLLLLAGLRSMRPARAVPLTT